MDDRAVENGRARRDEGQALRFALCTKANVGIYALVFAPRGAERP
jgi:hypothetical protein